MGAARTHLFPDPAGLFRSPRLVFSRPAKTSRAGHFDAVRGMEAVNYRILRVPGRGRAQRRQAVR